MEIKQDFQHKSNVKHGSVCILNIHPGVDNKYDWRTASAASQRGRGGISGHRNILAPKNIQVFEDLVGES